MYENSSYIKHTELIENSQSQAYIDALYDEKNPIYFYNNLFFRYLAPLVIKGDSWLTVGDGLGIDAAFIKRNGGYATASDLSDKVLLNIKSQGFIDDGRIENAEKLSAADNSIDYICCKEAYHHFPRPHISFYEMLRVAKKGVILMEPNDLNLDFAPLMFIRNVLDRVNTSLLRKIWKNQYSYETVGNFVFKISVREFEKMACALDLPYIAHRGFNTLPSQRWKSPARQLFFKGVYDAFCTLGILPRQHLSIIIFKEIPDNQILAKLKAEGYKINKLPRNPYAN